MAKKPDPIISIAAAARAIGITKQALHDNIRRRLVRSHPDGVRISEVVADRRNNVASHKRPLTGPTSKRAKRKPAPSPSPLSSLLSSPTY